MSSPSLFFAQPISKSNSDSSTVLDFEAYVEVEKDALSASSPSLCGTKDLRAYEHDRQRVKKAADLVKMRARKGQGWASKLYDTKKGSGASFPSEKAKRLTAEELDSLQGITFGDSKDLREETISSNARSEVKLADLIVSRKPRKVKEEDFEVIPHTRSVIVLDDMKGQDVTIDEPWEHIYGEDEENDTANGLSYAKVLSVSN